MLTLASAAAARGAVEPPAPAPDAFAVRGYYVTFMRSPAFGLPQWKAMIRRMRRDGANTLILWMGGAFRSRRYPVTWRYNAEHRNVKRDFARRLIDDAHRNGIRTLLALTPFAYDGVNQFPLEHPGLRATGADGRPAPRWGMHSWGYPLCPSRPESRRFMLDYAREMLFEFYPNADGLLIESSDYAICHCPDCLGRYYDREYEFVREISDDLWKARPDATIMVYPHYFNGRLVPGFDARAARKPFDPRWSLFFTPHSAPIDDDLARQARQAVYWNEGITLGGPETIRDGARLAKSRGLDGYLPSLEPFSCPSGPPENPGPLVKPFHLGWLADGAMPLDELPVRVNRIAYREYARRPFLGDDEFREILAGEIFGKGGDRKRGNLDPRQAVQDLLVLREVFSFGADWFAPPLLLRPDELADRANRETWTEERREECRARLERVRAIEARYRESKAPAGREMSRIARLIVSKWSKPAEDRLLTPGG